MMFNDVKISFCLSLCLSTALNVRFTTAIAHMQGFEHELSSSGPGPGQVQVRSRSGPGQEGHKLT